MMGFLFNEKECQELQYLLRRELEELLLDLGDKRIDGMIRAAMEERYATVFKMYGRLVSPSELAKYARNKTTKTIH